MKDKAERLKEMIDEVGVDGIPKGMTTDQIIRWKDEQEKEMFTRVAIFDTYCRTTIYKDHYKRHHEKLTEIFKKYSMYRDGTTADSYTTDNFINDADNIVERLHDDSLVRHQLNYKKDDNKIMGWELVAVSKADHLPFEIKEPYNKTDIHTHHNADSGFMTLQFDLDVGLKKQLDVAKKKLQEKRDIYKKSFQKGGKVQTSKYNLDDVLSHLECLATRDNSPECKTIGEVCKKLDMGYETFTDKFDKAIELIRSKKIVRFFPQ